MSLIFWALLPIFRSQLRVGIHSLKVDYAFNPPAKGPLFHVFSLGKPPAHLTNRGIKSLTTSQQTNPMIVNDSHYNISLNHINPIKSLKYHYKSPLNHLKAIIMDHITPGVTTTSTELSWPNSHEQGWPFVEGTRYDLQRQCMFDCQVGLYQKVTKLRKLPGRTTVDLDHHLKQGERKHVWKHQPET